MLNAIANYRYVVMGKRADDDRVGPYLATDDRQEAERALADGVTIDGRRWNGLRVHDRRTEIMPLHGWYVDPDANDE